MWAQQHRPSIYEALTSRPFLCVGVILILARHPEYLTVAPPPQTTQRAHQQQASSATRTWNSDRNITKSLSKVPAVIDQFLSSQINRHTSARHKHGHAISHELGYWTCDSLRMRFARVHRYRARKRRNKIRLSVGHSHPPREDPATFKRLTENGEMSQDVHMLVRLPFRRLT